MSKLPFSLESMNYEATQRWVEQAYSVPNYLKSACMHFGIKYVGVKKDWMSKQLLMRLNNKQGSEQVIEKSQVAKIIPVTKDGDILSIPVNSTVVTHSASHLTCDVLDGWDGQSSDVLKGWIGKSSPILSEPYDIKTTNTNYPYIKQFTVNGVEIKREWKDENPLRFGYFVFNKFIDIRFITDYMTIVEDWDTPSVIDDDYDNLYKQRDNYQTYAEWDEKVWIPYVKSVILTYVKKPEQETLYFKQRLEETKKTIRVAIYDHEPLSYYFDGGCDVEEFNVFPDDDHVPYNGNKYQLMQLPIMGHPDCYQLYIVVSDVALESLEDQHKAILTEIESCEDWEQISELEEKAQEIFKQIKAEKEILKRIKAEKPKKQKKESKLRKKSSEPKMIQGIKGKPVINYGVKGEQRQKLIDFLTEWRTKSEIMEYMGWKEGYCRNHFTYIINWGYDLLKEGRKENRRYKIES